VKVRFWGVRGFYPASGGRFVRYGGNTAALEVVSDRGARLGIDFGTGAIPFGRALLGQGFGAGKGALPVLLSHTHLDHTAALPFFMPVFIPGNRVDIYGAASGPLRALLEALFNPHVCPINSLDNLAATIRVHDVVDGPVAIDGFVVEALRVPHGQATGVAWRIEADGKRLAVITAIDHPPSGPLAATVALARGADVLLHDATWSPSDNGPAGLWGGARTTAAIAVAEQAEVRRLVLTHHAPQHDDAAIDALVRDARAHTRLPVEAAIEGEVLEI